MVRLAKITGKRRLASAMRILAVVVTASLLSLVSNATGKTLNFSGYDWTVRENGRGNPENNNWLSENAWVDATGRLHLKLTYKSGQWYAAEVFTTTRLGFGTYEFDVETPLNQIDKNVVLGLFSYPTNDVGPDRTHEIDIEIARWGEASNKPLNYSVWPVRAEAGPTGVTFDLPQTGPTTHSWTWRPQSIAFKSSYRRGEKREFIATYTFKPGNPALTISARPMPVHMNLWIKAPPSNGRSLEVVISAFRFKPDGKAQ